MPVFDSVHDQIQQFNRDNFTDSRNTEKTLREIRINFLKSHLDLEDKIRLTKEANNRYDHWSNVIKCRFFKIFNCLFDLNIITKINQETDHQVFGEFLVEKRHSQVAFVNNLLSLFHYICNIDSISKIELQYLKAEIIKNPKLSEVILIIFTNHKEDFREADIKEPQDLQILFKDFIFHKQLKFKRTIPSFNLANCNNKNYNEIHRISEEGFPIGTNFHSSNSTHRAAPAWRPQIAPRWNPQLAPRWNPLPAPSWNRNTNNS